MPSCHDLSFGRWSNWVATSCTPLIYLMEIAAPTA